MERQRLETALVQLRDPLSRIALAASQLDDIAIGGSISKSIRDAVSEIDLRIEDTLEGLRPRICARQPPGELGHSLSQLALELRSVLAARGIELRIALCDRDLFCDASVVRRVVCRLLLGVGHWMREGTGGALLSAVCEGKEAGIRVEAWLHRDSAQGTRQHDLLAPLRGFAPEKIRELVDHQVREPGRVAATVWLAEVSAA